MDDILSKVKEILGDPQKLEGFKNLASSLLNNDEQSENNKKNNGDKSNDNSNNIPDIENILKSFINNNSNNNDSSNKNADHFNIPLNMDMLLKLQNAMSMINQDDRNIEFLKALKLLLGNEEKQQKVDSAIKIMRLIKLIPLIKDLNLLKDFKII